jgi:hypothetical protein
MQPVIGWSIFHGDKAARDLEQTGWLTVVFGYLDLVFGMQYTLRRQTKDGHATRSS